MNQKALLIAKGLGCLLMTSMACYTSAYALNKSIKYIKNDCGDDYDSFIKLGLGSFMTGAFIGTTLITGVTAIRYFKLIKTI